MIYILGVSYLIVFTLAYGVFDYGYITDIIHGLRGQLLLGTLGFAVLLLIKSRVFGLITLAISMIAVSIHFTPTFFDVDKKINTLLTNQVNLRYSNQHVAQHLIRLNQDTCDLLVLFEFSDHHRELFSSVKPEYTRFGYKEIEGFPMEIGVVSKYPIIYRQVVHIDSPKSGNTHLKLLVDEKILNSALMGLPIDHSLSF
ncbi:hypothetical protein [Pseudoalteromonas aurantia]|uniref:Uncharacterized protein n=1 Tax=Pseudoalteromonas aurantia TaxID=43654 RepID=A0A5S3VAH0_9GAMM|nr:hypothetical protein [Pseudoalteromonas aurantia]TMO66728.1 hypothetical protein CWC18_02840 [Pseudoalteromonas aurantia]TMO68916.1 hypothetical protein CWC19_07560 [Pseudoalteromonas aurantia]TMO71942.1 hypothetical protein CWC20_16220 [Pseudoalteromonas aurantia]